MKENKTYIPIGIDCSISHYLRGNNLRNQAFPFDWNVTPTAAALALVKNKFEGFLDLPNLQFLPPTKRLLFEEDGIHLKSTNDIITPVICHRYGILFPHDFSEAGIEDLENVKIKYERRINNMLQLIEEGHNIEFIYHNGNPNLWQLEQYNLAGKSFKTVSESEIKTIFNALQLQNASIISFKQFKRSRMTLNERCQNLYKRFTRVLTK